MKGLFDHRVEKPVFSPGDQVWALLPLVSGPANLQVKFAGPVLRQISDQNDIIATPDGWKKSRLCPVNLLKPYYARLSVSGGTLGERPVAVAASVGNPDPVSALAGGEKEDVNFPEGSIMHGRLRNSESLSKSDMLLDHLSESRRNQLIELIHSFPSLFSDTPSHTHWTQMQEMLNLFGSVFIRFHHRNVTSLRQR